MLQVAAVSLGWTVLLTLGLLRGELLERWKAEVPLDAPNRYVFNIQPAEGWRRQGGPPGHEPVVARRVRLTAMTRAGWSRCAGRLRKRPWRRAG